MQSPPHGAAQEEDDEANEAAAHGVRTGQVGQEGAIDEAAAHGSLATQEVELRMGVVAAHDVRTEQGSTTDAEPDAEQRRNATRPTAYRFGR